MSATSSATLSAPATRAFTVNGAPPVILPGQTTASGSIVVPAGAAGSPLTALAVSYLTDGHDLVNGLGGSARFGENVLAVGDDNSSSAINITSVFGSQGLNFFGHDYTSIYINNNGNITFAGPSSAFTPSQITAGANNPIIAAFWADVDTRGGAGTSTGGNSTGSNRVYYDLDATNGVLTVTWDDVGYYNSHKDKLDAFQLQLVSLGNGNFDIVYRFQNINWTTGDASGGSGGLAGPGGSTARAGYLRRRRRALFRAAAIGQPGPDACPRDCDRQHRHHRRRRVPGAHQRRNLSDHERTHRLYRCRHE